MTEVAEEKFLKDVLARDDRPPEQITEGERMQRYLGRKYVLEAVVPRPNMPALLGRCPTFYDDPRACVAQAREMMAEGKDITEVRIRETRSWEITWVEKR
jgi:hypothetical protein